ncbi:MAG: hypothetical protein ACI9VT_002057, partial [Psychroserpens sp.]
KNIAIPTLKNSSHTSVNNIIWNENGKSRITK